MRKGSTFYWLLSDHLGSTSKVATAAGALHSQQLYKAWGESRYTSGTLPTRYTYTGQYSYANDFGLVFYGSRFYDPLLSRWASPDSIIPSQTDPLSWDRFAYTFNNPVKYNDPSGHCPWCVVIGAVVGAAVGYGAQVVNNYQDGITGTDAWTTNISGEQILGGAVAVATVGLGVGIVGSLAGGALAAGGVGATAATAACGDGDCTNETTSLYRAVGQSEFDDIMSTNIFRPKPGGGSMDMKWFWEGMDSAQRFAAQYTDLNHIVEAKVPSSILETGYPLTNLDGLGRAVGFMDDALTEFNKVILTVKDAIAQ